jgi:hypothetical protein
MSVSKVCRYCKSYVDGVCTNDAFSLVTVKGSEYDLSAQFEYILSDGELLETLESVLPKSTLSQRLDVERVIKRKILNVASDIGSPEIYIFDPDTFGCTNWR